VRRLGARRLEPWRVERRKRLKNRWKKMSRMRKKTTATLLMVLSLLCLAAVPIHAKESISVEMDQVQLQCRRWDPAGWRYWYHDYPVTWDFERSGNVLHTEISYQPGVSEEVGTSQVYVYDKQEGLWILHEGTIEYVSPYSGLWITEYWKGYLEFDGEPSQESFVHGAAYQWGYVFGYDEDTPPPYYAFAEWDETMGAWELGFSVYIWDETGFDQSVYFEGDPEQPILTWEEVNGLEPVPKSDYNPLDQ